MNRDSQMLKLFATNWYSQRSNTSISTRFKICETLDTVSGTQTYKIKIPKNISYKHDYACYKYQTNLPLKIMNTTLC